MWRKTRMPTFRQCIRFLERRGEAIEHVYCIQKGSVPEFVENYDHNEPVLVRLRAWVWDVSVTPVSWWSWHPDRFEILISQLSRSTTIYALDWMPRTIVHIVHHHIPAHSICDPSKQKWFLVSSKFIFRVEEVTDASKKQGIEVTSPTSE